MHRRVREWAESTCAEKPTYISSYVVDPSFPKDTLVLGGLFLLVHEPQDEPRGPLVFMGTCNACKGRRSSPSPSLFLFPFFSWQDSPAGKTRQNPPRWGDFFRRGLFASTNYRVPVPLVMVRTQTAFGVRTNLHIDFFARSKSKLQKVSPCPLIILCLSVRDP